MTEQVKDPKVNMLVRAFLKSSMSDTTTPQKSSKQSSKTVTIDEHPDIDEFDTNEPFVESHGQDNYKGSSKLRFANQRIEIDHEIETFPTNKLYPHTMKWNPLYSSPSENTKKPKKDMPQRWRSNKKKRKRWIQGRPKSNTNIMA